MILGENYMGIFSKIMGTHSERELKRVYPIVLETKAYSKNTGRKTGRSRREGKRIEIFDKKIL